MRARYSFACLILLCLFSVSVQGGLLEDAFAPLVDIDIPSFYARYSTVIDAMLFLTVFIGLAQLTIGKHFGNSSASKAVSVGVGIALSFGLIIMESRIGFSIGQFGTYAAGIFIILVASVLFFLLRKLVGGSASFAASYIITFFLLHAIAPGFFSYLKTAAPWLSALLSVGAIVGFIVTLLNLVSALWPGSSGAAQKGGKAIVKVAKKSLPGKAPILQKKEFKLLKQVPSLKQGNIVAELEAVLQAIKETPESRDVLLNKLDKIMLSEGEMADSLAKLQKLYRQVQKMEIGTLIELKKLPPLERKSAQADIKRELRKLNVEERLKSFASMIKGHTFMFQSLLEKSIKHVGAGKVDKARDLITDALDRVLEIEDLNKNMKELHQLLLSMTTTELVGAR